MENIVNEIENNVEQKLGIKVIDVDLNEVKLNNEGKNSTSSNKKKNKNKNFSKIKQFNRFVSSNLNDKQKLKKEWIIIAAISALLLVFFVILLGFMQYFVGLTDAAKNPSIVAAKNLNEALRIISIFSVALIGAPYVYMLVAFFFGVNQVHKSKISHMMIWFSMIVVALLLIASCCILIAAYYGLDPSVLANPF